MAYRATDALFYLLPSIKAGLENPKISRPAFIVSAYVTAVYGYNGKYA